MGVPRPVYQGGVKVGEVQEYSDTLMRAILSAKRLAYRTSVQEVTGAGGAPLLPSGDETSRAARVAALLALAAARQAVDDLC